MPQLPASLERSVAASPLRRRSMAITFLAVVVVLLVAGILGFVAWLRGQPGSVVGAFFAALLLASLLSIPAP